MRPLHPRFVVPIGNVLAYRRMGRYDWLRVSRLAVVAQNFACPVSDANQVAVLSCCAQT